MTIEEKRKLLFKFCNDTQCRNCPLNNALLTWTESLNGLKCLNIRTSPEADLDRAIEIVEKYGSANEKPEGENDVVNHPKHYTDGKIEVIEFIEDKKLGFCLGNAVKYIARAGKKDPTKEVEDLKKARWYIERRIKEIEESKE